MDTCTSQITNWRSVRAFILALIGGRGLLRCSGSSCLEMERGSVCSEIESSSRSEGRQEEDTKIYQSKMFISSISPHYPRISSGHTQDEQLFTKLSSTCTTFSSSMLSSLAFSQRNINPHILNLPQPHRIKRLPWLRRIRQRKVKVPKQLKHAFMDFKKRDALA